MPVSLDLSALDGQLPILLLPVRIETRFDVAAKQLRVRIYPDEIFAETHEPELTARERAAGEAYWRAAWGKGDERAAWGGLVQRTPVPRAAWIVRALTPLNVADRKTAAAPKFPDPPQKQDSWTRPATASLLPDRWLVVGYRGGGEVARALSRDVVQPLALTVSPQLKSTKKLDGGLEVDPGVLWTVDYPTALDAGMAVDLPLGPSELTAGLDALVVVGVRTSLSPDKATQALADLLDGHHYTRGLAFVAQGTPTNNTEAAPAGFPPPDPGGANSFAVEREPPALATGCDGLRFAGALGLPAGVVERVAGADRDELAPARAMADALWPATLGYFAQQMMVSTADTLLPIYDDADMRRYFVDHVRARGRYPAFRVGAVPYGVLPVTRSEAFVLSSSATAFEGQLDQRLRDVSGPTPLWRAAGDGAPRATTGTDPDAALLAVLGMDASTREVRIRSVVGPVTLTNLPPLLALFVLIAWQKVREDTSRRNLTAIDEYPAWDKARFAWLSYFSEPRRFAAPLVAPPPLSETEPLPDGGYLAAIAKASIDELHTGLIATASRKDEPLLQRMIRHAALCEYARRAYDLLLSDVENGVQPYERYERELVKVKGTKAWPTIWERFDGPLLLEHAPAAPVLKDFLLSKPGDKATGGAIGSYQASVAALARVPTADLERLFTETLDVCSHRLDAWITSRATRRLEDIRALQAGGTVAAGSHVGAFAWVEDLRPAPAGTVVTIGGRTATRPAPGLSGGYVQAPSTAHAATAAVLRNAHLSHNDETRSRYAVNLSSVRARAAREILDGVRNGQPLGAVLGYRFERGLHAHGLDRYIAPARALWPLVANKGGRSGEPVEAIAARNVVDGLRLRAAYLASGVFGAKDLPANRGAVPEFTAELDRLNEAIDGVADLLTAESVFQLVRGNVAAGTASLDALAQGNRSPDPAILHAPRLGLHVAHRVALVVGDIAHPTPGPGWPAATPRATAEPLLDAWVGSLLGDPRNVRCRVSVPDPREGEPDRRKDIPVALDALGLRPLDLLALAGTAGATAEDSELDRRVAAAALAGAAPSDVRIVYAADPTWDRATLRSFPEILELCRAIAAVVSGARPLRPGDLRPPEAGAGGKIDTAELDGRAGQAWRDARDARDALAAALAAGTPALGPALDAVARFGVAGAFPPIGAAPGELAEIARSALGEINRRLAIEPPTLQAIFGGGFVALPRFDPDHADLENALASGPSLGGEPGPIAIGRWFQQAARVRPALGRWRALRLRAEALGASRAGFDLAQLPFNAKDAWLALRDPAPSLDGKVSLVLARHAVPAGKAWAGLLLDEWVEVIPRRTQNTSLAFHFDNPGAEAPQAIAIAVPPDLAATSWTEANLLGTLRELRDLVRIRAVDGDLLPRIAQVVPPIFLADDDSAVNTVATSFDGALLAERTITGP